MGLPAPMFYNTARKRSYTQPCRNTIPKINLCKNKFTAFVQMKKEPFTHIHKQAEAFGARAKHNNIE
jgi:hypothetical protein